MTPTTPDTTVAEQRLADFIAKRSTLEDGRTPRVSVYTFRDEDGGLRVSEVDVTVKGDPSRGDKFKSSGAAWMRSDIDCAGMILACEDFILWHDSPVEDHGDGSIYDPGQEVWRAVEYHITGSWAAWIERQVGDTYPKAGV